MADKEYIERGALKQKKVYSLERHEYVVPVAEIDWIPATDVVEVVRCKDCVWWEARTCGSCVGRCENPRNGLANEYSEDTDYCSYGKRKEQT